MNVREEGGKEWKSEVGQGEEAASVVTDSLKQARGKESPMQREKMIPRYYLLNCLGSNSFSNGLKPGAQMYENTQWTKSGKGVHSSEQRLTCDDFDGFLIHRKLNNAE